MEIMDDVLAVILGGGRGSRLFPLTRMRSKPAVPIAGKYRLIDIPISNCINSKIFRIAVLTQFNSVSLHRHITRTYQFDSFHTGWVQVWAAEQTTYTEEWYQGTADAVRKQLFEIKSTGAKYTLVLAGDHLYRMDYAPMLEFHKSKQSDITVAVQPVPARDASRFGLLKRNSEQLIVDFAEKPTDPDVLNKMVSLNDPEVPYLGSMGIYLFNTDLLVELLTSYHYDDFGDDVIPHAIKNQQVYGFDFNGYWKDIGTIRSFYNTNLDLTSPTPPFNFFDTERPIYSRSRFLPGSTIQNSNLERVLLAEGCCITNATIKHSVIGLRSQIRNGVHIQDSILMGADYYERSTACNGIENDKTIPIGIGKNTVIEGAIIDKNARVGSDVTIRSFPRDTDLDADYFFVRDGILVIPKDTTIPNGVYIGPVKKIE